MSSLFNSLQENQLFHEWYNVLDWIFDDEKFSQERGWNKVKSTRLTKKISKLDRLRKENYIHCAVKNIVIPDSYYDKNSADVVFIIGKSESKCKDLIRHIRNGIAHGKTRCKNVSGVPYIEICDFHKDKGQMKQTAYIYMPINYIVLIHRFYDEIKCRES